jgi:hypothetical protein
MSFESLRDPLNVAHPCAGKRFSCNRCARPRGPSVAIDAANSVIYPQKSTFRDLDGAAIKLYILYIVFCQDFFCLADDSGTDFTRPRGNAGPGFSRLIASASYLHGLSFDWTGDPRLSSWTRANHRAAAPGNGAACRARCRAAARRRCRRACTPSTWTR